MSRKTAREVAMKLAFARLFGGEDTLTPHYVSVRLDARTGELTEAPVVGQYQKGVAITPEFDLIK